MDTTKAKLVLAEHNYKKLIHEMNNTFRVPNYMWTHTEIVIDQYKEVIHDLLYEIKTLKKNNF